MEAEKLKLPSQFKLKMTSGDDRVVLMSFALLNHLCALLPNPDSSPLLVLDADLRTAALQLMLSERDKETGVMKQPLVIDNLQADLEAVEDLLNWAGEHVVNFTLRMAENAMAVQMKNAERLVAIKEQQKKASDLVSGLIGQKS